MEFNDSKDDNGQPDLSSPNEEPEELLSDDNQTVSISPLMFGTTTSVSDSMARIRSQLSKQNQQQASSITLKILGIDNLISFNNRYEITLGRMNPSTKENPDVDLSGLPINVEGVSRQHLKLVHTKGRWYVEDMGSRNGSWLNGRLLTAYQRYALKDGDQIRAGNVIIIAMVNYQKAQILATIPNTLALVADSLAKNKQGLSPDFLVAHLMPYLNAVIEMMQHVDRAKKRSHREISVVSMVFDAPVVTVRFNLSNEIFEFIRREDLLQRMSTGLDEPYQSDKSSVDSETQAGDILRRFADEYLPLIERDQSLYYQRLLVPLLQICLDSEIGLAV